MAIPDQYYASDIGKAVSELIEKVTTDGFEIEEIKVFRGVLPIQRFIVQINFRGRGWLGSTSRWIPEITEGR